MRQYTALQYLFFNIFWTNKLIEWIIAKLYDDYWQIKMYPMQEKHLDWLMGEHCIWN